MGAYSNGGWWCDPDGGEEGGSPEAMRLRHEAAKARYARQCEQHQEEEIRNAERRLMALLSEKSIESYEIDKLSGTLILTKKDAKLTLRLLSSPEVVFLCKQHGIDTSFNKGYGKRLNDETEEAFFLIKPIGRGERLGVVLQNGGVKELGEVRIDELRGLESAIEYADNPWCMRPVQPKKNPNELAGFLHLLHENPLFMQLLENSHFTSVFHVHYFRKHNVNIVEP